MNEESNCLIYNSNAFDFQYDCLFTDRHREAAAG